MEALQKATLLSIDTLSKLVLALSLDQLSQEPLSIQLNELARLPRRCKELAVQVAQRNLRKAEAALRVKAEAEAAARAKAAKAKAPYTSAKPGRRT